MADTKTNDIQPVQTFPYWASETDPREGKVAPSGMLKGDGNGGIVPAVPGQDYREPGDDTAANVTGILKGVRNQSTGKIVIAQAEAGVDYATPMSDAEFKTKVESVVGASEDIQQALSDVEDLKEEIPELLTREEAEEGFTGWEVQGPVPCEVVWDTDENEWVGVLESGGNVTFNPPGRDDPYATHLTSNDFTADRTKLRPTPTQEADWDSKAPGSSVVLHLPEGPTEGFTDWVCETPGYSIEPLVQHNSQRNSWLAYVFIGASTASLPASGEGTPNALSVHLTNTSEGIDVVITRKPLYVTLGSNTEKLALTDDVQLKKRFTPWTFTGMAPGYTVLNLSYYSGQWRLYVEPEGGGSGYDEYVSGTEEATSLTFDISGVDPDFIVTAKRQAYYTLPGQESSPLQPFDPLGTVSTETLDTLVLQEHLQTLSTLPSLTDGSTLAETKNTLNAIMNVLKDMLVKATVFVLAFLPLFSLAVSKPLNNIHGTNLVVVSEPVETYAYSREWRLETYDAVKSASVFTAARGWKIPYKDVIGYRSSVDYMFRRWYANVYWSVQPFSNLDHLTNAIPAAISLSDGATRNSSTGLISGSTNAIIRVLAKGTDSEDIASRSAVVNKTVDPVGTFYPYIMETNVTERAAWNSASAANPAAVISLSLNDMCLCVCPHYWIVPAVLWYGGSVSHDGREVVAQFGGRGDGVVLFRSSTQDDEHFAEFAKEETLLELSATKFDGIKGYVWKDGGSVQTVFKDMGVMQGPMSGADFRLGALQWLLSSQLYGEDPDVLIPVPTGFALNLDGPRGGPAGFGFTTAFLEALDEEIRNDGGYGLTFLSSSDLSSGHLSRIAPEPTYIVSDSGSVYELSIDDRNGQKLITWTPADDIKAKTVPVLYVEDSSFNHVTNGITIGDLSASYTTILETFPFTIIPSELEDNFGTVLTNTVWLDRRSNGSFVDWCVAATNGVDHSVTFIDPFFGDASRSGGGLWATKLSKGFLYGYSEEVTNSVSITATRNIFDGMYRIGVSSGKEFYATPSTNVFHTAVSPTEVVSYTGKIYTLKIGEEWTEWKVTPAGWSPTATIIYHDGGWWARGTDAEYPGDEYGGSGNGDEDTATLVTFGIDDVTYTATRSKVKSLVCEEKQ